MPIRNWSLTISQLAIFFEGRLDFERSQIKNEYRLLKQFFDANKSI